MKSKKKIEKICIEIIQKFEGLTFYEVQIILDALNNSLSTVIKKIK